MRLSCTCLAVSLVACSSSGDRAMSTGEPVTSASVNAYSGECDSFEALDFGRITASALSGHAWSGSTPAEPLQGVRITLTKPQTSEVLHQAVTSADGRFDFRPLPAGDYAVSACLDGFDENRFLLVIDPGSNIGRFDLFLGPSEAGGRRDVVTSEN